MKKAIPHLILMLCLSLGAKAGNGDSIFNMVYVHNLYITFPYPDFYDSLVNSHSTDIDLKVNIQFNNKYLNEVGIKAKGNSSFNNPSQKKSFKIDMNEFVQGQDLHGLKKLNFNNSFKDPSFMKEKLTNDFLISHGLPAPRTTYCNVYMNNQLWGLYVIVEEVDDEFCEHWFNSNDGNLFKGDPRGDLRWKGSMTQTLYEADYELKNNSTTNNWSDLIGLIDIINNTPAASLQASLDAKLNTSNFLKQWIVLNMFSGLDSYIGSGHNYFIYHDTVTDKFQWIAWDNNESFGGFKMNLSSTQLKNLDIHYLNTPTSRPLCNNMLLNTAYKDMYNTYYCQLKQDFSNAYFDPKIDSIRNVIQQYVYNDPKKFYPNTKFDSSINYDVVLPGPNGMTVFGLKSFIQERKANIESNMASKGIVCWPMGVSNNLDLGKVSLYPNPCQNELHLDLNESIQHLKIVSQLGQVVGNLVNPSNVISTENLRPGLYYLMINNRFGGSFLKE
jgi:spore coat protein H